MGKAALSLGDPLSLFTAGLQGGDHINQLFDAADLVVAVGYDLVEYAPTLWNQQGDKSILHMDFDPAETDSDYAVAVELVADVADSLWQLNETLNAACAGRLPLFNAAAEAPLRARLPDEAAAHPGRGSRRTWGGRHPAFRRRRPQDVGRPALSLPRAEYLSDFQRLLFHGLRPAGGDRRAHRLPRPAGGGDFR